MTYRNDCLKGILTPRYGLLYHLFHIGFTPNVRVVMEVAAQRVSDWARPTRLLQAYLMMAAPEFGKMLSSGTIGFPAPFRAVSTSSGT